MRRGSSALRAARSARLRAPQVREELRAHQARAVSEADERRIREWRPTHLCTVRPFEGEPRVEAIMVRPSSAGDGHMIGYALLDWRAGRHTVLFREPRPEDPGYCSLAPTGLLRQTPGPDGRLDGEVSIDPWDPTVAAAQCAGPAS
jgi:hypothetical protein